MEPLEILVVSSEVTPFAKTGGLADVSAALTRHLARQGHQARLLMPLYRRIRAGADEGRWTLEPDAHLRGIEVELGERSFRFSVETTTLPNSDATVVLLDCPELFGRDDLYGSADDEPLRWAFLSKATLVLCQHLGKAPDVLHLNDWHTGLTPLYLRARFSWDELFARTKTVLTIHNLGYQGVFPQDVAGRIDFDSDRHLFHQGRMAEGALSFLETGLLYADALTTVSRTYAREIQTPEQGMGLDGLLRERADSLVGIVNGIDAEEWDPGTDEHLEATYSVDELEGKQACKRALLEDFHLAYDERAPVLGIVSRLTAQKGFELLPDILPILLRERDLRLVVLGSGEERHEAYFQWLRDTFPDKVAVFRGYAERHSHRVEAGSDFFLMPSRYEPCGLNQMYSQRYGAVPIVRRTGGLADTVEDYDPVTGDGTGFVFSEFDPDALLACIRRALAVWDQPHAYARVQQAGMLRDFSWERRVDEYVALYRRLLAGRPIRPTDGA